VTNFLALIISHLCIKTVDLMIDQEVDTSIMRSKVTNNAFLSFNLMIDLFIHKNDHEIESHGRKKERKKEKSRATAG
jgi:hypothetical protein